MRKSIWILVALLTSCSFKPESNLEPGVNVKTETLEREKLRNSFVNIEGLYQGEIVTPRDQRIPVEIGLFQVSEIVGKSPRGDTKMLPVLKARFRRLDLVSRYSVADASFVSETGELSTSLFRGAPATNGSSNSSSVGSNLDPFSTQGYVVNGVYTAVVTTSAGTLGTLRAQWTDRLVEAPATGEANEFNQFLRKKLQQISGVYTGEIQTLQGPALQVELKIDILEGARGSGSEPIHVVTIREFSGLSFGGLASGVYRPETS
ncbi:MAG: hypothetical protein WCH11_06030, partial [Bdellovibrio sp.]